MFWGTILLWNRAKLRFLETILQTTQPPSLLHQDNVAQVVEPLYPAQKVEGSSSSVVLLLLVTDEGTLRGKAMNPVSTFTATREMSCIAEKGVLLLGLWFSGRMPSFQSGGAGSIPADPLPSGVVSLLLPSTGCQASNKAKDISEQI